MNKELIKKYKKEFDHWLDGGELLYWSGIQWDKVLNGFNWYTMGPIIINDEYVEFRKALAEGKTVQHNICNLGEWTAITNDIFIDPLTFSDGSPCYRIKPDEPKFKVGDWVTQNSSKPFQFTENTCFLGLELWKPQPGEHIWDNTYGLSVVENVSLEEGVLCRECFNGKVLFTPTMKEVEPFIGTLPSFLQD